MIRGRFPKASAYPPTNIVCICEYKTFHKEIVMCMKAMLWGQVLAVIYHYESSVNHSWVMLCKQDAGKSKISLSVEYPSKLSEVGRKKRKKKEKKDTWSLKSMLEILKISQDKCKWQEKKLGLSWCKTIKMKKTKNRAVAEWFRKQVKLEGTASSCCYTHIYEKLSIGVP